MVVDRVSSLDRANRWFAVSKTRRGVTTEPTNEYLTYPFSQQLLYLRDCTVHSGVRQMIVKKVLCEHVTTRRKIRAESQQTIKRSQSASQSSVSSVKSYAYLSTHVFSTFTTLSRHSRHDGITAHSAAYRKRTNCKLVFTKVFNSLSDAHTGIRMS